MVDMRAGFFVFAAGCTFQGVTASDAPGSGSGWWDPAWSVRVPIKIRDGASVALGAGYQVGLQEDVSSTVCPSSATLDDVRIVFGTTELARSIDVVGPHPWIWFKLAAPIAVGATSSNEYWLYCHNPNPPAVIGGAAQVFDFYDAFTTLDPIVWTLSNSPTIGSGGVVCGPNNSGVVTHAAAPTVDHAVDFAASAETPLTAGQTWWGGYQNGTGDVQPWAIWYALFPDTIMPSSDAGMERNGNTVTLDTALHLYGVEVYADHSMTFRHEDVAFQTYAPDAQTMVPPTVDVRLWNNSPSGNITFAWVRTRQAVSPAPTVTLGTPQME
jgi:hypothetical protein